MVYSPNILRADASEMHSIMLAAASMARHRAINVDRLSEILTALATDGTVAPRNAKGYDVQSPSYGFIEVKARTLGTDGPDPRVSLSPGKLQTANFFMAVRWTEHFGLAEAIMLPLDSVRPLFDARLQRSARLAHITWHDWKAAAGRIDFTERFQQFLT